MGRLYNGALIALLLSVMADLIFENFIIKFYYQIYTVTF